MGDNMKLEFFVNTYGHYYDDEKQNGIEGHFGLNKLFTQEQLEEFVQTLPEQYRVYVLDQYDDVKEVKLGETEVSCIEKRIIIEQSAVIKFTDNSKLKVSEKFTVTMDYNSLYDCIESLIE